MTRQLTRARAGDLTVGQLTITELQAEINRRVDSLKTEREKLQGRLDEIERQLIDVSAELGDSDRPVRRRPRNDRPLAAYVTDVLEGNEMTTREIADTVIEQGYQTSSANFANNVTAALHREDRFVKNNGRWSIAD